MRLTLPILGVFALALGACTGRDTADRSAEPTTAASAGLAEVDVPPATAPATPVPDTTTPLEGPMPAPGTISYAGFGPAKFGATQEEVRMAWGKDMAGSPSEPGGCYYLYPQPQPQPQRGNHIAFMIEGDKFARVDVNVAGVAAPGGGQVGMSIDEIRKLHAGIEEQPHKYVEGAKNLRHKDASGGVLVFETDPAGKVTAWRVGVPPQVDYVEGCG